MLRYVGILCFLLLAGCVSTQSGPVRPQPESPEVLARFIAVVCSDLLSMSDGELHRLDHLDSNGKVRIVLPAQLRDPFLQSAADLRIELERVVVVEEDSTRELDEPYLTFFYRAHGVGVMVQVPRAREAG